MRQARIDFPDTLGDTEFLVAGLVEARESAIDGLGVFAVTPFSAGQAVLAIDDSRAVDEAHPLRPGEEARHCDYLAAGKVVLMLYPERHINHSCDPNTKPRRNLW